MLDAQVNIRMSTEEKKAFTDAATACGLNMPTWLRMLARQAAGLQSVQSLTQRLGPVRVGGPWE